MGLFCRTQCLFCVWEIGRSSFEGPQNNWGYSTHIVDPGKRRCHAPQTMQERFILLRKRKQLGEAFGLDMPKDA